ncbi:MAG TPA: hypothetical protein VGR18_04635 [Rubrobacter sp.]|nr:hypothetical protein [Rubrobacter sp.]
MEDLTIDRVPGPAGGVVVETSAELLGPLAAVDEPLLVPDRPEGPDGRLGDQALHVRVSEGGKAVLGARAHVRITRIGGRAHAEQDQAGVQVGLVDGVEVDVAAQVAKVPDKPGRRVDGRARLRPRAVLARQPGRVIRQVVGARPDRLLALAYRQRAVGDLFEEELGEVGTGQVAPREAPEDGLRHDPAVPLGAAEVGEAVEVVGGPRHGPIVGVILEVHVTKQRHPIEFPHLAGVLRLVDARRGRQGEGVTVRAHEGVGETGLRIGEPTAPLRAHGDSLETGRAARSERPAQHGVRLGPD